MRGRQRGADGGLGVISGRSLAPLSEGANDSNVVSQGMDRCNRRPELVRARDLCLPIQPVSRAV